MVASEWGGCLPAERYTSDLTQYNGFDSLGFNTGRSAIYAAVLTLEAKRVWLPAWLCPTVRAFLLLQDIEVLEYHVDSHFQPLIEDSELLPTDSVVWTNWLGCVPREHRRRVIARFGARLIIDNCHACFDAPDSLALNVYALRKVVGVPHGAYLVGMGLNEAVLPNEVETLEGSDFLETSEAEGSNAAYGAYRAYSEHIGGKYARMHPLVAQALAGLSLRQIALARRRNLAILARAFPEHIAPNMDIACGMPIWYPFYVTDDAGLRERLIESHVWVPRLWKRVLSMPDATSTELTMARWLMPLPMDQRYSEEDMHALVKTVRGCMDEGLGKTHHVKTVILQESTHG